MIDRSIAPEIHPLSSLNLIDDEHESLKNGIEIYVIQDPTLDVLRVDIQFKAGTIFQDKPLLASSTINMITEGTKQHTSAELSEIIDYYGTFVSKHTTHRNSEAGFSIMCKHAEPLIHLLYEMVTESIFPEKELKLNLMESREEFLIQMEGTSFLARRELAQRLFGKKHPLTDWVKKSDFKNLTAEEVAEFHRKHYNADGCRIFLTGNVTDDILKCVRDTFSALPGGSSASGDGVASGSDAVAGGAGDSKATAGSGAGGSKATAGSEAGGAGSSETTASGSGSGSAKSLEERVLPPLKPSPVGRYDVKKKGAEQSSIRIGKMCITRRDPDFPVFMLLNTIFGGYFGSRLMSNIREKHGYTYGIRSAYRQFHSDIAIWYIAADVNSDKCDKAIDECKKEMARMGKELVSDDELARARETLHSDALRGLDGAFAQSLLLKRRLEFGLDPTEYITTLERIKTCTAEEIRDLARRLLNPDDCHIITVG